VLNGIFYLLEPQMRIDTIMLNKAIVTIVPTAAVDPSKKLSDIA
jgi:hypothetical protein